MKSRQWVMVCAAAAVGAGAAAKAQAELQNTNFMQAVVGRMKDPKMKEMMCSSQVMANQMYAGLPRYLNLSDEKREQLDKLLADRQFAYAESGMAMFSGMEDEKRAAIKAAAAVKEEYDKAICELLGKDDYEVFHLYEESMPDQMQITAFKGTLPSDLSLSEQ
jgi:hypothetical protein